VAMAWIWQRGGKNRHMGEKKKIKVVGATGRWVAGRWAREDTGRTANMVRRALN
jgi:hypothetical protein